MAIVRGLAGNRAILNAHVRYSPIINHFHEFGVVNGLNRTGRLVKFVENGHQHNGDDQPKQQIFSQIIQDSPRLAKPIAFAIVTENMRFPVPHADTITVPAINRQPDDTPWPEGTFHGSWLWRLSAFG